MVAFVNCKHMQNSSMCRHCFKHFMKIKCTNISGDLGASLRPVTNWVLGVHPGEQAECWIWKA